MDYDEQLVDDRGVNGCKSNNVAEMRGRAKIRDYYAEVLFLVFMPSSPRNFEASEFM